MLAVIILLTFAATASLVLSQVLLCSPSSDITHIPDVRLCNDSDLSILFNVSDSCDNIMNLLLYVYNHNSSSGGSAIFISHQYFNYSDQLCGGNVTLTEQVRIDDEKFSHTSLLQIRLRELCLGNCAQTCSNNFYLFLDYTGFLGPPVNIDSNSYNCSIINVTWSDPDYQCGIEPLYYNLSIYDAITGSLVKNVPAVYDTSYQFVDNNLFIHRYTYVITGVNELGEGISNNDTFSYQRVPRTVTEAASDIITFNETTATASFNIPITLECTGEAPENASVTIWCSVNGIVYDDTILVDNATQPMNITGLISVPQYQQCNISIVFSNEAGSSKPFILAFGQNFCEQSEHIDKIPDLENCNGTGTIISFIYRPPSEIFNCSSIGDDYRIVILHHDFQVPIDIENLPPPERYNDTACLVHLTLSPDISVKENNDTILQVWMMLTSKPPIFYCSNNFTLQVDSDPPDPVNPTIHVGCSVVDVKWSVPFSPPGCPVRQYDIELNDESFNITNTSLLHHSWSDLLPNRLNTLSISAVNDIGPSIQSNNTFITAINPQVLSLDYDVLLVDGNASLTIKAKVNDSCTYSVPTHLNYNVSCDDDTVVNETRDVLNGQFFYQLPVPIDHLNCTACLIWSNLNSSLTFCNITFNTTQLLFIKLQPISNGLNFTCHYRPNSSLWGCGILVNNSNKSVLSINKAIGTVTDLCPGKYNVTNFYIKDGMDHVIEYVTVDINGTSCGTPTPSGSGDDDNSNLLTILLSSLITGVAAIIIIIIVIVVLVCRYKNKSDSYPMDNGGENANGRSYTNQTSEEIEMETVPTASTTTVSAASPIVSSTTVSAASPIVSSTTVSAASTSSANEKEMKPNVNQERFDLPTTTPLASFIDGEKASMNEGKSDSAGSTVNDIEHKSGSSNEAQGTGTASNSVGVSNDVDSSQKGRVLDEDVGGDDVDEVTMYETEEYEATGTQEADINRFVSSATNKTSIIKKSKSSDSLKSTSSASKLFKRLSSIKNTETDQEKKNLLSTITDDSDAVHQDLEVPASNNDTEGEFVAK